MKNYYAILEVPVGSPVTEIREAYRRLVQENLWNKETFAELKEAFEVLTTPARRNEYDKATFGETFGGSEATTVLTPSEVTLGGTRHCPMGLAGQCPVINARVPLQETYCPECGILLSSLTEQAFEPISLPDPAQQMRLEDGTGRLHTLRPGLNTVGRETTDVLLPDKTISRRHAQIEVTEIGTVVLEDLGSTNGTRVNSEVLSPNISRPLRDGDDVQFGSVSLRLHLPAMPVTVLDAPTAPAPPLLEAGGESAPRARLVAVRGDVRPDILLAPGVTTFGRRPENSVVLREDRYVSGQHAQVTADEDLFRLTDLGSTNGTLVNGELMAPHQARELSAGDEVVIGGTAYRFERLDVTAPTDDTMVAEGEPSLEALPTDLAQHED